VSARQLAILFAVLDVTYLFTQIPRIPSHVIGSLRGQPVAIIVLLMEIAVAVSAVAWFRSWQLRFWITYLLFPARLALAIVSFAWLAELLLWMLPDSLTIRHTVWGMACLAELARLVATVILHWINAHSNSPAAASRSESALEFESENPYRPPGFR